MLCATHLEHMPLITFALGLIVDTVTIQVSSGLIFGDVCFPSQASLGGFPDVSSSTWKYDLVDCTGSI